MMTPCATLAHLLHTCHSHFYFCPYYLRRTAPSGSALNTASNWAAAGQRSVSEMGDAVSAVLTRVWGLGAGSFGARGEVGDATSCMLDRFTLHLHPWWSGLARAQNVVCKR